MLLDFALGSNTEKKKYIGSPLYRYYSGSYLQLTTACKGKISFLKWTLLEGTSLIHMGRSTGQHKVNSEASLEVLGLIMF